MNFHALRHPRRDMVLVAIAGPVTNLALAALSAAALRLGHYFPVGAQDWLLRNLLNALAINVLLAVFNMLPIPPLDGGRVLLGFLHPGRSLSALRNWRPTAYRFSSG